MTKVAAAPANARLPGPSALGDVPWWVVAVIAVSFWVSTAVLTTAIVRRSRRPGGDGTGHAGETWLTLASAGIATGVAATGMWHVFGDALQMSGPGRVALFAFLEIALFTEAIRARRSLRQFGSVGVDGAAVWVLAALSAVLSALDSRSAAAVALRLSAPLVAAWLWERGLAAERRQAQGRGRRRPVAWRVTPQRVLVWLRLAEPVEREVGEVDRARRVARLVRAAWRYHMLTAMGARRWRVRRAAARLRRQALAAGEHIRLGSDETVRDQVRRHLAALYQVQTGTAPEALDDLSPWSTRHPRLDAAEQEIARLSEELAAAEARTAELEADRGRLAAELAAVKEQAERDRTASRRTGDELSALLGRAYEERGRRCGTSRTSRGTRQSRPDADERVASRPGHRRGAVAAGRSNHRRSVGDRWRGAEQAHADRRAAQAGPLLRLGSGAATARRATRRGRSRGRGMTTAALLVQLIPTSARRTADVVATTPASARSDRRRPAANRSPKRGPQRTDRKDTRAVSVKTAASAGPRDELLTVPQFCEEVGVEKSTYYRWRQLGRGPRTFKLPNGQVRIRRSALESWLTELEGAAR